METNVKIKYCHKCLSKLSDDNETDFCDKWCFSEYQAENIKLSQEVYSHLKSN